jgi:predicted dinucleotide-binding enzyme
MKIAVIGAGNVGRALGENWSSKRHDVVYGVRDPGDAKSRALGAGRVKAAKEAAAWAEVIVLATPWPATEAACKSLGDVGGRIVIDCTNPLAMGPQGLSLAIGFSTSGGEQVQGWCAGASVFKTLHQCGAETMAAPGRMAQRPVTFVAGDDAARKPAVLALVADLGFEAVDAGPLVNARLLEPYAMLWIDLAFKRGQGRDFAFALTRSA